ncbi:hypothetical protein GY15_30660 [Delftia sp. 670]|nr:hypothetical protein GY15_30660 [Delftia sp. 670]
MESLQPGQARWREADAARARIALVALARDQAPGLALATRSPMDCLVMPARSARSVSRSPASDRCRVMWIWAAPTLSRAARLDSASGTSTSRAMSCSTRASNRRMAWPSRRPRWVWRQASAGGVTGESSLMDALWRQIQQVRKTD